MSRSLSWLCNYINKDKSCLEVEVSDYKSHFWWDSFKITMVSLNWAMFYYGDLSDLIRAAASSWIGSPKQIGNCVIYRWEGANYIRYYLIYWPQYFNVPKSQTSVNLFPMMRIINQSLSLMIREGDFILCSSQATLCSPAHPSTIPPSLSVTLHPPWVTILLMKMI